MKIKTSELVGNQLALAVFIAEGRSFWTRLNARFDTNIGYTDWVLDSDGALKKFWFDESASRSGAWRTTDTYQPHLAWAQGGPIVEREKIGLGWVVSNYRHIEGCWSAHIPQTNGKISYSPTALIAAMHCFVAHTFGDEVDLPGELL